MSFLKSLGEFLKLLNSKEAGWKKQNVSLNIKMTYELLSMSSLGLTTSSEGGTVLPNGVKVAV